MEAKAHARLTDPETSHEAAESIKGLTGKQEAVLRFLKSNLAGLLSPFVTMSHFTDFALVRAYQGRFKPKPNAAFSGTSADIYPDQSDSGLRTRRKELVDRGLIEDSGMKVKLPSGRKAIVWRTIDLEGIRR